MFPNQPARISAPVRQTRSRCLLPAHGRRGVAPLEFAMFIPLLVIFILFLFWQVRAQHALLRSGLDAETATLDAVLEVQSARDLAVQESLHPLPQSQALRQLLHGFSPSLSVGGGGVQQQAAVDADSPQQRLFPAIGQVQQSHQRLAHSWHGDVFAFPQAADQQRPLTLPESVHGIAPDFGPLDAFRHLLLAGDQSSLFGSSQEIQFLDRVNAAERQVRDGIRQLNADIRSLTRALERELNRPLIDPRLIARLRRDLEEKRPQLRGLQAGLANLQQIPRS